MKKKYTHNRLTVTVPEMASMLGIGENMARKIIKERHIPYLKIGEQIEIRKKELENWLDRESGISRKSITGCREEGNMRKHLAKELSLIEADIIKHKRKIVHLVQAMTSTILYEREKTFPSPSFPSYIRKMSVSILDTYRKIDQLELQKNILERIQ